MVKKDELHSAANELADSIVAKDPAAVVASKLIVNTVTSSKAPVEPDLLLDRS